MREILFRGKRKDNGKWIEGSLITFPDGVCFVCCEKNNPDEMYKYEVIPETVGQYTESNDRDCNKIFEYDVVEFYINEEKIVGKVFYCKEATAFKVWYELPEQKFTVLSKTLCDCEYVKVIGNIYDNPELLEKNKRHRKLYLKLNTERSIGKAVDKALHFLFGIHVMNSVHDFSFLSF